MLDVRFYLMEKKKNIKNFSSADLYFFFLFLLPPPEAECGCFLSFFFYMRAEGRVFKKNDSLSHSSSSLPFEDMTKKIILFFNE